MKNDDIQLLKSLISIHSTPGDEVRLIDFMTTKFQEAKLSVKSFGQFGIVATNSKDFEDCDAIVTAHADSPGFILQSINADKTGKAVTLGSPHMEDTSAQVQAIRNDGTEVQSIIHQFKDEKEKENIWQIDKYTGMQKGDRICYLPRFSHTASKLKATFLDNRIGCWILLKLAQNIKDFGPRKICLAVTTQEEFTGFGAATLGNALDSNALTICLDATYADKVQKVKIGGGPVITLTDKSVLMSAQTRNWVKLVAEQNGIPLQEEVYNYSGTDARGFSQFGNISRTIVPLLVATDGNHTPLETAAWRDIHNAVKLTTALIQSIPVSAAEQ